MQRLSMNRAILILLTGILLSHGQARGATPQEVDQAIDKAKAYLHGLEKKGSWDASYTLPAEQKSIQNGGPTALAAYALLAAGENPHDPSIEQAVEYLLKTPSQGTYTVAMRCQLWLSLGLPLKPAVRQAFSADAAILLKGAHNDIDLHEGQGCFYSYLPNGADFDHSNSQIGVLGIWACAQAGIEIPNAYWRGVDYGWRAHQFPDGGWSYEMSGNLGRTHRPPGQGTPGKGPSPLPTHSMTAAGIATLFITQEYLHGNDGLSCPGNFADPNIDAGLEWMNKNYAQVHDHHTYYTLYGIERIGVASGRKYFGNIDWYKEGADYLVKHQAAGGDWDDDMTSTCFGLLFLVRGRAPVVMNKLQYEINMHGDKKREANWNQRPRDAANVVKWIGKQNEQFLNWQVVNLSVPAEELHDAPILYIAGNQALDFTDEEIDKLRLFVEEGGLIFANADCQSNAFCTAFKKVCRKLFPDYEFRDLPEGSPIYTSQQFPRDKWHSKIKVEALSNGARELVILVPSSDPARYWQTQAFGGHEELAGLMDDVFLYTVARGENGGLGLRCKGDTYIVQSDPNVRASKTLKAARLQFPGNWNPEPGAWRRLAAIMHNTDAVDLDVQTVKLGDNKLDDSFKVADLSGTFKFSLTQEMQGEIKKFVDGGGTLIVDSCGGDASFTQSARNEIAAIFPEGKLSDAPLPLDGPVLSMGTKLDRVTYRPYARKIVGALHEPRIVAMEIKGRPAVFFSAEDLACGLVGMPVDGIYGYEPASAASLMEKLVLFAGK